MKSIREEVGRSPIATTFTVIGAIATLASLIFVAPVSWPDLTVGSSTPLNTSYFVVLGIFLGTTLFAASLSRLALSVSYLSAYCLSIVLASCSGLISALAVRTFGLKFGADVQSDNSESLIYWGTLFLFLTINGESAFSKYRTLIHSIPPDKESKESSEDEEVRFAAGLLLVLFIGWALAVSKGQDWLASGIIA